MLRALLNRLLHPFPRFPFVPGHMFCPTDALAERIAYQGVETLVGGHPQGQAIAQAFNRFLDDPDADRAIRKEYHRIWEDRLRTVAIHLDPPEPYGFDTNDPGPLTHPLDPWAQNSLRDAGCDAKLAIASRPGQRLLHQASVWWGALVLVAVALTLPLLKGAARLTPRRWQVVGPNFWMVAFWRALVQAGQEQGLAKTEPIAFVLEVPSLSHDFAESGFPFIRPTDLKVPRRAWMSRVAVPSLRLTMAVLRAFWRGSGDARVVELAARTLNLAIRSLAIWRLGFNIQGDWYFDVSDSSSIHNLRAVILRKFGFRLARWPYGQLETPGVGLSYLDYDAYLSSGPYQGRHYIETWAAGTRSVSVGQVRNDHRLNGLKQVAPVLEQAVAALSDRGIHIATYFGNNTGIGFERPMMDLLDVVASEVLSRPDWALLIKPKGTNQIYNRIRSERRFDGLWDHPRVVMVRYEQNYLEVCPPGWLIDQADVGFGLPGSIQQESLVKDKPLLTYYPVHQKTLFRQKMIESGLMFGDLPGLRAAVQRILDDPADLDCQSEWVRDNFDPFSDDQALSRVARFLFSPAESSCHA